MKRKLIKQGLGGVTVSLPIKWVRDLNLEAGDEIDINETDKNLLISSSGKETIKEKNIQLYDTDKKHLRSVIAAAYKAGYDEINIGFKNHPKLQDINDIINSFTGLELISQTKNTFKIKSFLKLSENETDSLIIKMFQIAKLIAETVDQDWNKVDTKYLQTLLKSNQIKLRDHTLRTIHQAKYKGDQSYDYYDFVTILEKLSAAFFEMSLHITANKIKRNNLMNDLLTLLDKFYQAYLKKDYDKSNRLWLNMRRDIEVKLGPKNLAKTLKKEDPVMVANYYYITKLYRHLSSRLISLSS